MVWDYFSKSPEARFRIVPKLSMKFISKNNVDTSEFSQFLAFLPSLFFFFFLYLWLILTLLFSQRVPGFAGGEALRLRKFARRWGRLGGNGDLLMASPPFRKDAKTWTREGVFDGDPLFRIDPWLNNESQIKVMARTFAGVGIDGGSTRLLVAFSGREDGRHVWKEMSEASAYLAFLQ